MEELKRLAEQRQVIWKDMTGILEGARADGQRSLTAEEAQRYDALEADLDAKTAEFERVKRHADRKSELSIVDRDVRMLPGGDFVTERKATVAPSQEEYDSAFWVYVRHGKTGIEREQRMVLERGMRIEERAALGTTSGAVGGYLIPQGFADVLTRARLQFGGMLKAGTRKFNTDTGNPLPIPMVNDTGNAGALLTENTQITEQEPVFTTKTLNAYTFTSKLILISWQMLQDSYFDLPSFIASIAGERLGRVENTYLTSGTGAGQPQGILTGATAGVTAAAGNTTAITYLNLLAMQHAVDPAYRDGAEWMFHDSSLRAIRALMDAQGRPLWNPGYDLGQNIGGMPPSILNAPYTINQDMPVMAPNAKSVLYGDFSNYWIRSVKDNTLIRLEERYADYLQTGFFVFERLDGTLVNAGTNPIVYYANSAT